MPLSFRAWIWYLNYENLPTFDKLRELEEALKNVGDKRAPSLKITEE